MGAIIATIIHLIIMAVSLFISLLGAAFNFFLSNVVACDKIVLSLAGGIAASVVLHIHPAFCLLIGIAIFVALSFIQRLRFGYWILAALMTLFWAFLFGFITYMFTDDNTWFYVIFGLSAIFVAGLHWKVKDEIV